jgi:hypothetical protein
MRWWKLPGVQAEPQIFQGGKFADQPLVDWQSKKLVDKLLANLPKS